MNLIGFEGRSAEPLDKKKNRERKDLKLAKIIPKSEKVPQIIIDVEKILTEEEVVGAITEAAKLEGLNPADLNLVAKYYDEDSRLVGLEMKVISRVAGAKGWGSILYEYVIQSHTPQSQHPNTCIRVLCGDSRRFTLGGEVAFHNGDKWIFTLNEMRPIVSEADPE